MAIIGDLSRKDGFYNLKVFGVKKSKVTEISQLNIEFLSHLILLTLNSWNHNGCNNCFDKGISKSCFMVQKCLNLV